MPTAGIGAFALDGSPWPRPRAKTLEDRQYVFQASSDINEGIVAIGYPHSSLDWAVEAHTSWALPIDERWVASSKTTQAVGVEQIKELAQARETFGEALDIVACDGKYGNAGFLRSVKGLRCGITARLRADRVLYRLAPAHDPHQKGRPRKHGARFAFKEAETWGEPDEIIELEDPSWEQVWLEHWKDLHEKKGVDVPYALATWMIFLARPIVQDAPFPWQKPQPQMTPQRVQQSIRSIFALIGTPARPPKPRGIPLG